ncbi:MAG: mandelate racemase/muconate lactonizing enzyme family protein, partial [Ktedonobacteraceae bacterium]
MKLTNLRWSTYRIPFRAPFTTAHGMLTDRVAAVITAHTDTGYVGYGEIAPLPTHSGTSLDEALHALPGIAHELRGREVEDILHFLDGQCRESQLPAALLCGLETALLDVSGQASGQSIAELLARAYPCERANDSAVTPRTRIPVNCVMSDEATEIMVAKALQAVTAGFNCLKLKVTDASQATVERVKAIRAAIGPAPHLRLDANEGWDFEQARWMLRQCAECDIQYVEQPLLGRDLAGMARLRRVSPIPLAADEALSNPA